MTLQIKSFQEQYTILIFLAFDGMQMYANTAYAEKDWKDLIMIMKMFLAHENFPLQIFYHMIQNKLQVQW